MAKIYILGNNSEDWMNGFGDLVVIPSNLTINDNDAITSFILDVFSNVENSDKIVFALDTTNPELALIIAIHIRLSYHQNAALALVSMLFVSTLPQSLFLHCGVGSQLFLCTKGIYFCSTEKVKYDIKEISALTESEYKECVLKYINIQSDAKIGHHSVANEWGINTMATCLGIPLEPEQCLPHRNSLYFKYSQIVRLFDDANDGDKGEYLYPLEVCNKHILLIDDEAEKGLKTIVETIFQGNEVEVVSNNIKSFDELPRNIIDAIKKMRYDLVLLDLRLNGSEEKKNDQHPYSGFNILKRIKEINPGIQVIMITASNKAWNLKNLLNQGADGYYVKEAPDYNFSYENSLSNLESLYDEIEACLRKDYLRNMYNRIATLKKDLRECELLKTSEKEEIKVQLDSFYALLSIANPLSVGHRSFFIYAYIALEQVFEIIARCLIEKQGTKD